MMEHPVFIFAAVLIFGYALFSKIFSRSPITAPMVFCLIGIFTSSMFLDRSEVQPLHGSMKFLAELTLMLILLVDASTINLKALIRDRGIPIRLLGIGLPLTMIAGFIVAWLLFPGSSLWLLALIALILSPTDAALGQAVVSNDKLPEKVRQSLNVESGLNDGIALPIIMMCIASISGESGGEAGSSSWLAFMAKQLLLGPLVGGIIGHVGGRLVDFASHRNWMQETFQRLLAGAMAVVAYAAAEHVGGNGFIAAFFAGLLLGTHTHAIRERIQEFAEAEGQQLSLFIFLVFGLVFVPFSYPFWDIKTLIYAVLSLTVIRMIPVALCLIGTGIDKTGKLFFGWFGPRGIASVLYLMIAASHLGFKGYERAFAIITLTVLLSILLHGLTAVPFSAMYARKLARDGNVLH